jgi:S1-C subfamily serine protease
MGVRLGGLPDALREQLGLKHGLLVERVEAGSPAEKAGLVPGDVVLRADGKDVGGIEDFSAVLEGKKAGDTVGLAVLAGGKEAEVKLKLGAR